MPGSPPPSPVQIPGHVPICYYCHEIVNQAPKVVPTGHTGVDSIVLITAIIANTCIVLGFVAAWIRHRNRVFSKLRDLEIEVAEAQPPIDSPHPADVIIYLRIGHWALVRLPMRIRVDRIEEPKGPDLS